MKYVEIIANRGSSATILAIAKKVNAYDASVGEVDDRDMRRIRLIVDDHQLQWTLDALQNVFGAQPSARILVLSVEAAVPQPAEEEARSKKRKRKSSSIARESLYEEIKKSARLDLNFIVLVILSTLVAAIGMIENSAAVVIGAMVIAPLLGPNLALSLGTALGDLGLMQKSLLTNLAGLSLALVLSIGLGFFWPEELNSPELMARTDAGPGSIVLALASGAAAALSLTTGLSTVLVGVMVAVALLPPVATLGLMLGVGQFDLALGAGLLLAINVVSVNLSSKIVFFAKGIRPRGVQDQQRSNRTMATYIIVWVISLLLLGGAIYLRGAWI
jgi:uncharacterized hydrophobic protein (TIGR00341 family)